MTDEDKNGFNIAELMHGVFKSMGATPETIIVPNVLLQKDSQLELYVKGGRPEVFLSEQQGKRALRNGESLYRVQVYRVE